MLKNGMWWGGGACLRPEHGTGPPPPTIQVNCTGRLHCAGGGGGRGEHFTELKNIDKKTRSSSYLPLSVLVQIW